MPKGLLLLPFWAIVLTVVCASPARAVSEACPATLFFWPQRDAPSAVSTYDYELTALTERSVDATMLADTDRGWYEWSVTQVPIPRRTFAAAGPDFKYTYKSAESVVLSVQFPTNLVVRHAWVTRAEATGESVLGWDAKGSYRCDVPDLTNKDRKPAAIEIHRPENPTLPPAGPPVVATAAAAPFPPATCKSPFSSASVPRVVNPHFPDALVSILAQPAETTLYVAIDENGKLVDTWVLAGSGYPAIDAEAQNAARLSRYDPATSYCRQVGGVYVVDEIFTPP
jgi:hypothetical protein